MEILRDKIKLDNNDNYILFEQGGIGKTSQMKAVFRSYALSHKDGIVPIFVDCKTIDFNRKQPLLTHILLEFCGEDCPDNYENSIVRLENMLTKANSKYKYVFFIDGINECENNNYLVVQDIAKLLKSPSNKIIVSSRINENDIGLKDFKRLKVKEFTDAQIVTFLNSKEFKDNGNDIELNRLNPSLLKVLRVPMFLRLFVETYSAANIFPDMYTSNIVRKADLLQAFINKIFDDKKEQHSSENDPEYIKRKFALERYLPALAYEMMLMHKYSVSEKTLTDLVDNKLNYKYFKRFANLKQRNSINIALNDELLKICTDEISFINKSNDNYAFSHQVWQDFFCGKFYELCIKYDVLEPFENAMPGSVKQFIGEIIGECDFESKDNLDTEASPIERFLQKHNLQQPENKQLSAIQTRNLVEIMKTSRNNNITADYSYLNLQKSDFVDCKLCNSNFSYSIITYNNFNCEGSRFVHSLNFLGDDFIIFLNENSEIVILNISSGNKVKYYINYEFDSSVSLYNLYVTGSKIAIITSEDDNQWNTHCYINIFDSKLVGNEFHFELEEKIDYCIRFEPNIYNVIVLDKSIYIIDSDNKITIYEDEKRKEISFSVINSLFGFSNSKQSFNISSDKKIYNVDEGVLSIFNFDKKDIIKIEIFDCSKYSCCEFYVTPKGRYIAFNISDYTTNHKIIVCDLKKRKIIMEREEVEVVVNLSVSEDGAYLVYSHFDGTIFIWNVELNYLINKIIPNKTFINQIAFSANRSHLALQTSGENTLIWDYSSHQIIKQINTCLLGELLCFSTDGSILIYGNYMFELNWINLVSNKRGIIKPFIDIYAELYNYSETKVQFDLLVLEKQAKYMISNVILSSDNKTLAIVTRGMGIFLFDINKNKIVGYINEDLLNKTAVTFSPDGRDIVYSIGGYLYIVNLEADRPMLVNKIYHGGDISNIQYSKYGERIYCYEYNKHVILTCFTIDTEMKTLLDIDIKRNINGYVINSLNELMLFIKKDNKLLLLDSNNQIIDVYKPIQSNIINCVFYNIMHSGIDNHIDDFYKTIYQNGGIIPKKYNSKLVSRLDEI